MILGRGRIFGLVLFKRRVGDQAGSGFCWAETVGSRSRKIFLVQFRIFEQDQEFAQKWLKVVFRSF